MNTLTNMATEAKEKKQPHILCSQIPYAKYIGMEAINFGDELLGHLPFNQSNIGNPLIPALHGGVIGGFMECSAQMSLLWHVSSTSLPKTVDFSIDYLRSPQAKDTYALTEFVRVGGRLANIRVITWQSSRDKPIAIGIGNFILTPA